MSVTMVNKKLSRNSVLIPIYVSFAENCVELV